MSEQHISLSIFISNGHSIDPHIFTITNKLIDVDASSRPYGSKEAAFLALIHRFLCSLSCQNQQQKTLAYPSATAVASEQQIGQKQK